MDVPFIRLYEDIICHHYYNGLQEGHIGFDEHIDEDMCKEEEIQEQLNILLAGLQVLMALPRRCFPLRDKARDKANGVSLQLY